MLEAPAAPSQPGASTTVLHLSTQAIRSCDFDALTDWERASGYQSERVQLSRGAGVFTSEFLEVGDDLLVSRHASSKRLHSQYSAPPNTVEFLIGSYPGRPVWCGVEVEESAIVLQPGGHSCWSTTPENGFFVGFVIPENAVRSWELIPESLLGQAKAREVGIAPVDPGRLARLSRLLDVYFEQRTRPVPAIEVAWLHDHLLGELRHFLRPYLGSREPVLEPLSPPTRRRLVEHARDLMADGLEDGLTTSGLAKALGVSRRTLELAFGEAYGTSPYQFYLALRLHAGRRLLQNQECSVLEACVACGFENAGRFAGMYSRHFGELPSETLRRAPVERVRRNLVRGSRPCGSGPADGG